MCAYEEAHDGEASKRHYMPAVLLGEHVGFDSMTVEEVHRESSCHLILVLTDFRPSLKDRDVRVGDA